MLGGGHYNSGGFGDVLGLHSFPYDSDDRNNRPDDGWAATQHAFGEVVPAKVYAICARVTPEYVKEVATIPPDGSKYTMEIECPVNTLKVTSGGSRGPASVREVGGAVPPGEWWQEVANHGTTARDVTSFAICTTLDTVVVEKDPVVSETGKQTVAEAQCPAQAPHVVGGAEGTLGPDQGNIGIAALQPFDVTEEVAGWRSWIDNYNAVDMSMFVAAICVPSLR